MPLIYVLLIYKLYLRFTNLFVEYTGYSE